MAIKPERKLDRISADGFDVVCTIGHVEFGDGDKTPYQAALALIGEHGAQGYFTFPAEDGGTVHVDVAFEPPRANGPVGETHGIKRPTRA